MNLSDLLRVMRQQNTNSQLKHSTVTCCVFLNGVYYVKRGNDYKLFVSLALSALSEVAYHMLLYCVSYHVLHSQFLGNQNMGLGGTLELLLAQWSR